MVSVTACHDAVTTAATEGTRQLRAPAAGAAVSTGTTATPPAAGLGPSPPTAPSPTQPPLPLPWRAHRGQHRPGLRCRVGGRDRRVNATENGCSATAAVGGIVIMYQWEGDRVVVINLSISEEFFHSCHLRMAAVLHVWIRAGIRSRWRDACPLPRGLAVRCETRAGTAPHLVPLSICVPGS